MARWVPTLLAPMVMFSCVGAQDTAPLATPLDAADEAGAAAQAQAATAAAQDAAAAAALLAPLPVQLAASVPPPAPPPVVPVAMSGSTGVPVRKLQDEGPSDKDTCRNDQAALLARAVPAIAWRHAGWSYAKLKVQHMFPSGAIGCYNACEAHTDCCHWIFDCENWLCTFHGVGGFEEDGDPQFGRDYNFLGDSSHNVRRLGEKAIEDAAERGEVYTGSAAQLGGAASLGSAAAAVKAATEL